MAVPNFSKLEQDLLKEWREKNIFAKTLAKPSPQGDFVFFEGPPTANGMPHMGHVETRIFKDVILRYKTMRGYHVERKAGWDTQGLPVEIEIEKELGVSGKKEIEKYGIDKFNAKARQSVWKYKEQWEKMTERVGFWIDFDQPYITYTNEYIETLWWIFKQIWDQKLLVQDYKVVPYCPRCGTALSSHEVAQGYETVTEPSVYLKFELVKEPGTFILAWTTTPWTLPGNVALAVDPDIDYVKVKTAAGDQLILAKALIGKLAATDQTVIETMPGKKLVGQEYRPLFEFLDLRSHHPLTPPRAGGDTPTSRRSAKPPSGSGAAYTIVPADFVTTEDGTGVVHTAVMYGEEDFNLGKKISLPTVHTVDEQGKFTALVKPWAGQEVRDAKGETQRQIIAWLKEHGKLYRVEDYTHEYPFCWRCHHPLLYYAKTSWFIQMSKLRAKLIANNEKINWFPAHLKEGRFGEWLREVKDWAVSRERYWGTPLPIWQCDQCHHQECLGSYEELINQLSTRNRYIFLRHGESINNLSQTLDTVMDNGTIGLSERGKKQSAAAATKLKKEKIDVIYTSQFKRAKETAEIIGQALDLKPQEDQRINEYHIGQVYEGKTISEFHRGFGDRAQRLHEAPPGGETWLQIRQRMFDFLHQLDRQHQGKTFLIVTHSDPIYVVRWALSLQSEAVLHDVPLLNNAEPLELKFPAEIFQADGSFDPHRPFIDQVVYPCPNCGGKNSHPRSTPSLDKLGTGSRVGGGRMRRVPEVADAWFDSGAMPFAQWHYPFENKPRVDQGTSYPAEFITEAIDQTRGWFYTLVAIATLLSTAKIVKDPPYKNVVVLGHIRDKDGKKLSKSLGNYLDPMKMIDQHGADAIRFYLFTMNQPGEPKNFDPAGVDEVVKKTFFILMNVISFWKLTKPDQLADSAQAIHPLDRWILSMQNELVANLTSRLDRYDITGAGRALAEFITELSTWYVRRSRDRFKGEEAAIAAGTLRQILLTLASLMAPYTPFLAESVYREASGPLESVHLENWPTAGPIDASLLEDMRVARRVVEETHALRAASNIKVRQPLSQLAILPQLRPDLVAVVKDETNVKEIHPVEKLPSGAEWAIGQQVALDITITDELKEEGLLRDLVR